LKTPPRNFFVYWAEKKSRNVMPRSKPHIIHCKLDISFVTIFILPVRKCRLQLCFDSPIAGRFATVIAAAAMPECSGERRKVAAGNCE